MSIHVIEADHYREEIARLKNDPRIIDMTLSIWRNESPSTIDKTLESSGIMTHALDEAHDRGVHVESIGGPIRAIRELINDWRTYGYTPGPHPGAA